MKILLKFPQNYVWFNNSSNNVKIFIRLQNAMTIIVILRNTMIHKGRLHLDQKILWLQQELFCGKSAEYSKVFQSLFGLENKGKEKVKKFVASKNPPSHSDHQNDLITLSEKKTLRSKLTSWSKKLILK